MKLRLGTSDPRGREGGGSLLTYQNGWWEGPGGIPDTQPGQRPQRTNWVQQSSEPSNYLESDPSSKLLPH